jgi:hypothetical protein
MTQPRSTTSGTGRSLKRLIVVRRRLGFGRSDITVVRFGLLRRNLFGLSPIN